MFSLVRRPCFRHSPRPLLNMKSKYLPDALQRIPNIELLINVVSRRVRQINQGHRPLTQPDPRMEPVDIALKEIAEGKLTFETTDEAPAPAAAT